MFKNKPKCLKSGIVFLSNIAFFPQDCRLISFNSRVLKDFLGFIRLNVCLFVTGIGVSGYLLFNPIDIRLLWVALSCFFVGAAGYSFNMRTDKEEDLINRKKINPFAMSNTGAILVICFIILGAFFSRFLSTLSIIFYWIMVVLDIVYSYFRMKKIFPFKNLFTGFGLTQVFFIGAANAPITIETITYYFVISLFIFITSLVSDLRDYDGDKAIDIRTIPVVLGYNNGKNFAYLSLILSSVAIFSLNLRGLYTLLLFVLPIVFYLHRDEPKAAHHYLLTSFTFLPLGILLI